jgi:uncharacterized protein (DUF849 family)
MTIVPRLPEGSIWQIIAIGKNNLPLTSIALALGGNARAGMEDTLHLRRGELATSNAQLVSRAAGLVTGLELAIADVSNARLQLGLSA